MEASRPFVPSMKLTARQRATYLAHLYKAIFRSYHIQLEPYLARFIPADGTVIDVGAHAGQFTKIFARLARHGLVYAFEPSSYACSILHRVRAVRRLHNVTVAPVGLGAVAGRFELNIPIKRSGSLGFGSSYVGRGDGSSGEPRRILTETIEVETLDNFAKTRGLGQICFIKVDIEGWELHMLQGSIAVLTGSRPILMLEIHGNLLERAGEAKAALFEFLSSHGYAWRRIEGYDGKSRGLIRLVDDRDDGDFFCFPEDRLQDMLSGLPPG